MKKQRFTCSSLAISLVISFLFVSLPSISQDEITTDSIYEMDFVDDDNHAVIDTIAAENNLPWTETIKARLDKLLNNEMFQTTSVGMIVYDLTANSVLYKYNERQLMRPASTMKMITTVAALDNLGADHEYRTELCYTGSIANGVLDGNIYCKGDFDPMFDSTDLNVLVSCVKDLGISEIKGNICADLSMKDNDRLGEGWCWDDDNPVLTPLLLSGKDEFVDKFRSRLIANGIKFDGITKVGKAPNGANTIIIVSRTLSDLLPQMMKNSDNLYAEAVFYHLAAATNSVGPATAKQGRLAVNKLIRKLGLDPTRYYVADGSGLSLYNYVSPELEVEFLKYAYKHENIFQELFKAMPIAGVDGTLDDRMRSGYAHKNVHAKTGTVTRISALAGYCTAYNGHFLCFSIINMGIPKASIGRKFQDSVCESLCRP